MRHGRLIPGRPGPLPALRDSSRAPPHPLGLRYLRAEAVQRRGGLKVCAAVRRRGGLALAGIDAGGRGGPRRRVSGCAGGGGVFVCVGGEGRRRSSLG